MPETKHQPELDILRLFSFFGSLPVLHTLSIYLISLLLTWLIRKIPVVGKKIT